MAIQNNCNFFLYKTRMAYVWTRILNTPFWALYSLLPFIIYKDLEATAWQVACVISLKPVVSLLSLYWSALIKRRSDRLVSNIVSASILGHLPFFFAPFIDNPWYFVLASAVYMLFHRGVNPAWMEILKLNIPTVSREKVFAFSSALGYIGAAAIPFALGSLMDTYSDSWRWIFPVTALISLGAICFKNRIPIQLDPSQENEIGQVISWKQQLVKPWKNAWDLVCRRPDFARYQLGFMLGGSGLIIMQPALPDFFMDQLDLTYTDLAVAFTLCKGLGFAATSSLWARLMQKINIYRFNSWVTFLAFLFPLFLLAAQMNLLWLYAGYVLYGVMQGGSEMSWHLSGPLFSKEEDSSIYSSVNVLTVGLRGCFVPVIGSLFMYQIHTSGVMLIGGFLCLLSTYFMAKYSKHSNSENVPQAVI